MLNDTGIFFFFFSSEIVWIQVYSFFFQQGKGAVETDRKTNKKWNGWNGRYIRKEMYSGKITELLFEVRSEKAKIEKIINKL